MSGWHCIYIYQLCSYISWWDIFNRFYERSYMKKDNKVCCYSSHLASDGITWSINNIIFLSFFVMAVNRSSGASLIDTVLPYSKFCWLKIHVCIWDERFCDGISHSKIIWTTNAPKISKKIGRQRKMRSCFC